jgi:hypothetical protein
MPIKTYFKGSGNKVMANMKKEYGAKEGESVFYATANKTGMTGKKKKKKLTSPSNSMKSRNNLS